MAIIIPSSKIYAIDNSKVRNNVIERIEVSANNASTKTEYDKNIFEEDFDTSGMWTLPKPSYTDVLSYYNYQTASHSYSSAGGFYVRALGAGVLPIYKEMHFEIPKIIGNALINKVKYGQSNGKNNIKTSITYEYATWNALPTLELINQDDSVNDNRYGLTALYSYTYRNNKGIQNQELLNLPSYFELQGSISSMPILSTTFGSDKTNVSTAKVVYNEDKDLYEVDLTVLCGFSSFKVAFGKDFVRDENNSPISCGYFSTTGDYPTKLGNNLGYGNVADGIIEEYKPLALNVSLYGNTIELNLKEETLYINGEAENSVYSVAGSELMQTTNYRGSNSSIIDDFQRTQNKYSRGKETATILCSIGEYNDENGDLAISTKTASKMLFEHYDKVVPMVRNGEGIDLAMSYTADGLPKVFDVVGARVFFDGAVLQELTLREHIGVDPFYMPTEQLTYALYDGTYACTGLSDTTIQNIKVAKSIDGIPVTSIDFGAFQTRLIQSVVIPNNVDTIGGSAFLNCSKLAEISIGNGIKEIGNRAFYGNAYPKKVYITDVAKWCEIVFKDGSASPLYSSAELYLNGKLLENLVIPNGVVKLLGDAFAYCKSIKQLTIPDSVTTIGTSAFYSCSSLENLTIGQNVKTIGAYAFGGCSALTSVVIPDSVTSIENWAFYRCRSLVSAVIGNGIIRLESGVFTDCPKLTDIYVPWSEGAIAGAPWGATNATIHYNSEV